jgi:hypothetical protein
VGENYFVTITAITSVGEPNVLLQTSATPVHTKVNSHIHLPPNFSAFETIAQAVELAKAQEVGVLGVSNYYDFSIYATYADLAQKAQIFPLFGLEIIALLEPLVQAGVKINDPGNPGKMYICGKGISEFLPISQKATDLMQTIRDNDSKRMAEMTDRLTVLFEEVGVTTHLDAEAVKQRVVRRHGSPYETVYLQERHIAQAFQEVFFEKVEFGERAGVLERLYGTPAKAKADDPVGTQNDIRSYLMKAGKPAFIEDTFVDFDHAYRLILALGGIPCYPTLIDGTTPICPFEAEPDTLIADLKARGIYCAEFIPIRNSPQVLSHYAKAYRAAGMFITAGTEHNTLDLIPIPPTCVKDAPIPKDLQALFWEGACVVAAHQYLRMKGLPGFVDNEGKLNPAYESDEARIQDFAKLGEKVIAAFQQS